MTKKKAIVIGSGVAGLATAAYLAKGGLEVTLLEKNNSIGGRARQFEANGFTFDMGPSWYWMPEVFEKFYNHFGHTAKDFYELVRLSPSYQVIGKNGELVEIPSDMPSIEALFERFEPGSTPKLKKFLAEAAYKYEVGINDLVYKPGLSLKEFLDIRLLKGLLKMDVLTDMKKHIGRTVKSPFLRELLEFPVLFLGALPENTPALYSLMNYADMELGTWYPMGGMFKIIEAFEKIALEQGVKILLGEEVTGIESNDNQITTVYTLNHSFKADVVVSAGDYRHFEQEILKPEQRVYSHSYWENRKMAPSCLLFYVGVNKKLNKLLHHNLFFDADFSLHGQEIYTQPKWPNNPLFYVSTPSKTDPRVAPEGNENLFILMPIAPGLEGDLEPVREKYYKLLMDRLEKHTGEKILENVIYKRSYCIEDFKNDYFAFKGNAYGLANTITQTAILKPKLKSSKLNNLYFAGQLTVPGPGLPPSIISGKVAANQVLKDLQL